MVKPQFAGKSGRRKEKMIYKSKLLALPSYRQKWRFKLDFEHDSVIIDPKVAKLILNNANTGRLRFISN